MGIDLITEPVLMILTKSEGRYGMKYDAILMVVQDKIPLLKTSYPYLCSNLGAERIFFVANIKCKQEIEKAFGNNRIEYYNEDEIMGGLTLSKIKSYLEDLCGDSHRAGWFYQQFLKMAYAYRSRNDYYLIFDSDTVPINRINYFGKDERPNFITKIEYHKPYFDTLDKLFDGEIKRLDKNISYIAENMIINRNIMIEIIDRIMSNQNLVGDTFYERILNAINLDVVMYTGFSEFETYGNYVSTLYPGMYNRIRLKTQRMGSFLFGTEPTKEQLEWAAKDYDIISFETYGRTWLSKKTKSERIRERYTAKEIFDKYIWMYYLWESIRGREVIKYED